MILPPVFQTLKANPAILAKLGNDPIRIFHDDIPETIPQPLRVDYVTWFMVNSTPIVNLSDPPPADRQTVQVDCWSPTDKGVAELATLVRDTLETVVHMTAINLDGRETDTRLRRMSLQFDWWGR